MKPEVLFAWSGGKDSAFALYKVIKSNRYKVVSLLTTITRDYNRISMHGVRTALLMQQAESLGLPVERVLISKKSSNIEYESQMKKILERYRKRGVTAVAFGDIFLEDLRKYREENMAKLKMKAIFPIWKRDTKILAREFIAKHFKAIITCVDTKQLDKSFSGRDYDERFLSDLPAGVDPCGENGEFHSFVYDGPVFRNRIPVKKGETVIRRKRFCFTDLIPA